MGTINKALDKYSDEHHPKEAETETISGTLAKRHPSTSNTIKSDLECYEDIKTKIVALYPGESIKTIMFAGTHHGGGVTTTAINFAKTLAFDKKLKVLMMDANLRTPRFKEFFNFDHDRGLTELVIYGDINPFKVIKVGQSQLFLLATGGHQIGPVGLFESDSFDAFLQKASSDFDMVILDAAPIPSFAESRVLCKKVDGVVLVLESGKVRRQVAMRAKKELEDAGAKILGVVLNRRKYYIPNWIYKRL